jgi:two-component system NtrC family response regulator
MAAKNVLVVDDEKEVTTFFKHLLAGKNCEVYIANSAAEVDRLLSDRVPLDLALVDLKLPDTDGLELLSKIKREQASCEVIMMTGYSTVKTAVAAIQAGAKDYLEKPFDDITRLEELLDSILNRNFAAEEALCAQAAHYGIVFSPNSPMKNLLAIASKIAKKSINVLIEGETGTGKELLSRFIHGLSLRSAYPFVGINCGAISESLLESELFGHEKGAFTGAAKPRRGFFELANNGTLFLDEIGEAPLSIQVKLLRVLETGEFMRVGGETPIKTNIRVVAATNRNVEAEVDAHRFRADLLYRLEGVKLTIPALRDRPEDIPWITRYYLHTKFNVDIHDQAMAALQAFDWPGNVRQLLNVLNQTLAIHDCKIIREEHLPRWITADPGHHAKDFFAPCGVEARIEGEIERFVENVVNCIESVDDVDFVNIMKKIKKVESIIGKRVIQKGLFETGGNRQALSKKWNVSPRVLRYILNEK